MSLLAPLLDVQDLDVAADAARTRLAMLPERAALPILAGKLAEIEAELAAARAERAAREAEEEELGREVTEIARDIETAEVERYSGKRKNQDEAAAHKAAQAARAEKQAGFEVRELALLEEIEAVERRIAAHESARATCQAEWEGAREALRQVEAQVEVELVQLSGKRAELALSVPRDLMLAYERVRGQPRKAGRGAARLVEGRCGGCGINLPSLERTRMMAEPEDALIQCPQCRRVLIR